VTLQRHILRVVGIRVLAAWVVLVSILQILDLLDVTTDILDRKLGVAGVAYYAALRLPTLAQQVAPLAVLAGCLFAFAQLARENAVVALRSAGMSAYRLIGMTAPVAIAVVVAHLAAVQWLAPRADQALDAWWARSAPRAEQAPKGPRSFRVGTDIVVASAGDEAGRRLTGVSLYRRAPDGRLVERIHAEAATFGPKGWTLVQPRLEMIGGLGVQRASAGQMLWTTGPAPQDVRAIFGTDQTLAPGSARRALSGGASARSPSFYRTELQRGFAAPIGALVMLLLAGPVTLTNFRSGGAQVLVSCLGAGLIFLVVDGICTAMGQGGSVPAFLGAWAAPVAFAAAGASALVFMEG